MGESIFRSELVDPMIGTPWTRHSPMEAEMEKGERSGGSFRGRGGSLPFGPAHQLDEACDGVVVTVDDAFLKRDDRVVGDGDVLGTHLGAALGDAAVADS